MTATDYAVRLVEQAEAMVEGHSTPSTVYLVDYTIPHPLGAGPEPRRALVHIIEGYTDFEAIRRILAVREWGDHTAPAYTRLAIESVRRLAG